MAKIMVIGANPAWQKNVRCERLVPGEVVRVKKGPGAAAGKGFNCAQAMVELGESVVLVSGVGTDAEAWRQECTAHRIELREFPLEGSIRLATTVLESDGRVTEIVEEGPAAATGAQSELERLLAQHPGDWPVAICGTFPDGLDLVGLAAGLAHRQGMVLVDSMPLARQLLHQPVDCPGLVLKLNFAEWKAIIQHWTLDGVLSEARHRLGKVRLVLTAGAEGSCAEDEQGKRCHFPVGKLVDGAQIHPIGAGDAFSAGILVGTLRGFPFFQSCSFGSLVAQVSCRHPLPSRVVREEVDRVWAEIE